MKVNDCSLKKRIRIVLKKIRFVGLALVVVAVINVNARTVQADREWGSQSGPETSSITTSVISVAVPVAQIIDDPLGDHFTTPGEAIVDIGVVEGGTDGVDVTIQVNFSPDTVMSEIVGFIDLDTDQNPLTGIPPFLPPILAGTSQDIGADFTLDLFGEFLPEGVGISVVEAVVIDSNIGPVGVVPVNVVGQSMQITVPLSMLGGDDGIMDVTMVLGTFFEPTDWAPDSGHGTIGVAPEQNSLIITPQSGPFFTSQTIDLGLILDTDGSSTMVDLTAILDGDDISTGLSGCIQEGLLLSGGETFRCGNVSLDSNHFGPGIHTLSVTVELSDGTILNDTVNWEIFANVEP